MSSNFEDGVVDLCRVMRFRVRALERVQDVNPDTVSRGFCLDLTVQGLIPEQVFMDAIVLVVEGREGVMARVYRVRTQVGHVRLFLRRRKPFEDDELDPLPPGVYIWIGSVELHFPRTTAA